MSILVGNGDLAMNSRSRHGEGRELPQSSMLVAHVRHGNGVPQFNQETFAQLLEESLGHDEQGQPNLTDDLVLNQQLILVVTQAGLDRMFDVDNHDPFQSSRVSGKTILRLKQCLAVLNLAIQRTHQVLLQHADSPDLVVQHVPVYMYLFPKLLCVLGKIETVEISQAVLDILDTAITTSSLGRGRVEQHLLVFLQSYLTGAVRAMHRMQSSNLNDDVVFVLEDFDHSGSTWATASSISHASPYKVNVAQVLSMATKLAIFLCQKNLSREANKQVRKQRARLHQILEEQCERPNSTRAIEQLLSMTAPSQLNLEVDVSFPNSIPDEPWPESDRARKRPRISSSDVTPVDAVQPNTRIFVQIVERLTGHSAKDLDGLSATVSARFPSLSEHSQIELLEHLGQAACELYQNTGDSVKSCPICDEMQNPRHDARVSSQVEELLKTLIALKSGIQRHKSLRLTALSVLGKLIAHTDSNDYLRLKGSPTGDWCLQSMRSSSRDLKIVAAQALLSFVRTDSRRDAMIVHENRVLALEYLQALWDVSDASSQEVVVLNLCYMARIADDDELNIILLRLVDYLGCRNAYISGVVYSELQALALHLQLSLAALLRPYWRTLAVVIVKNFGKRPEIAQQLSDLLGVQVDGLLQIIEQNALPYLVLNQDKKLIERICASSSSAMSPFDVCTKQNNLPRILALLLSQAFPKPEQTIMALLGKVSSDFGEQDLSGWIGHNPVQIASELLESIADASHSKTFKIYQGFHSLAQFVHRKSGSTSSARKTDPTAGFLETNALAIVTRFSARLNEGPLSGHNVEKRRCLTALGEIVKLGKSRVRVALPQISACLRAAVEDPALSDTALLAWITMISSLEKDDLTNLLSQTFAIIIRSWPFLSSKSQDTAHSFIATLLKQHQALVREVYETLPSLANIPLLSKFESEISTLKHQRDEQHQVGAFVERLHDENSAVVQQAMEELVNLLRSKHEFVHKSIMQEQPDQLIEEIERAILDACVKFDSNENLQLFAAQCLGAIGCLDPSRLENIRDKKRFVLASNFAKAEETTAFLMFFMEEVLVQEYVSTSNLREKGFLAWSLQQLLTYCDLPADISLRPVSADLSSKDRHWFDLSETTRLVLTPFLTSKFSSTAKTQKANIKYPFFKAGMPFKVWLTEVTIDMLSRGTGENVDLIFDICGRLVSYGQGVVIPSFLFPYTALYLILNGTHQEKSDIVAEMSGVLSHELGGFDIEKQDHVRQCSQLVFDVLDYMSLWLQETRKQVAQASVRAERGITDPMSELKRQQIDLVAPILRLIPPKVITQRAIECKSYARALFHQEQYMKTLSDVTDADYRRLQDIYAQIDEPDGIEGISAQIKLIDVESEVMEHKKAGRWNTAQSWYEMQLIANPDDLDIQMNLMKCLKESGQHDVLIHHFDGFNSSAHLQHQNLLPFAIEAAWVTTRWDKLSHYLVQAPKGDFSVGLGTIMNSIKNGDLDLAKKQTNDMFRSAASDLTFTTTKSFQASHDCLLKVHVLDDVRLMVECREQDRSFVLQSIDKRLDIMGSYVADKQYLLGIQRAIMHLRPDTFKAADIATSWLTSARLARKAQATNQAFNSVLRASSLGDRSAAIEQAKLMWQQGHHRKAIQSLEGAIESGAFGSRPSETNVENLTLKAGQDEHNVMTARAFVLLGRWLDQAGQTQSDTIIKTFRKSTEQYRHSDKGWYNLGRHYNKILDSEKLKPPGKESQQFLTGETAKLVIDNFLRALACGNKYLFQALPKVLTLWLELVATQNQEHDSRRGNAQFHMHNANQRKKVIEETNNSVKKYLDRIPVYALYTILPQLVARICHTDQTVSSILQMMIVKVVRSYPQQALWTVLATVKSSSKERATRGISLIRKIIDNAKKDLKVLTLPEMREFVTSGQKFSEELLRVADFEIQARVSQVRLAKDLGFNHKIAPSKLVVPCEACLIPNIPSRNELASTKGFRPFAKEPITIDSFLDEAKILPSLQKPRKLMIRGSDGKIYSVLAKPRDDLRKDQRLMEFDTMINRFLKRDINASKRRLYIRTYAVVPLNEECGLIEWVDGLKTMRDILLELYRQRGVIADYNAIREQLDQICNRSDNKAQDFLDKVQARFPLILRQWFVESFPDSTNWFNARLRYTRSSAVMSMVGHVLGLGDRHGENILFEQGNGGILHVDFNCLFDKGLTFDKPELVPFRLTHNMIDAFGPYKVDGPFRRSCEITLSLLRSNEDALMTILETFLHDPTTDFMTAGKKRKVNTAYGAGEAPDTPERMLEGVRGKVRGMLAGESVPLSVGGYVEEMIRRASDGENLARMYIGWCAFF